MGAERVKGGISASCGGAVLRRSRGPLGATASWIVHCARLGFRAVAKYGRQGEGESERERVEAQLHAVWREGTDGVEEGSHQRTTTSEPHLNPHATTVCTTGPTAARGREWTPWPPRRALRVTVDASGPNTVWLGVVPFLQRSGGVGVVELPAPSPMWKIRCVPGTNPQTDSRLHTLCLF